MRRWGKLPEEIDRVSILEVHAETTIMRLEGEL
jgi:hypothetical protein